MKPTDYGEHGLPLHRAREPVALVLGCQAWRVGPLRSHRGQGCCCTKRPPLTTTWHPHVLRCTGTCTLKSPSVGSAPLFRLKAHDKPTCTMSFCPAVRGLLSTGSTDKKVRQGRGGEAGCRSDARERVSGGYVWAGGLAGQ